MCVMVGGRERMVETAIGVDTKMKVRSDGGIAFSESQSDKSCEVLLCELWLPRMKKSSARVVCGPTISNSPSAWFACVYMAYNLEGGRGVWMAVYRTKSRQRCEGRKGTTCSANSELGKEARIRRHNWVSGGTADDLDR